MIPNLTTSGLSNIDRVLEHAHLFGQINISIDGLRESYRQVRGFDGFARADAALRKLRAVKREVGINVVVTRHNFHEIESIVEYARRLRLSEVELLRFKPAGRGISAFAAMTCSDEQHRAFLPTILRASRRHRMRVRVDCSYTPMLAHHRPSLQLLRSLCVYGCTGGDFLIGAKANGTVTACSFAQPTHPEVRANELSEYWQKPEAFGAFRAWKRADEPCASCDYHSLCRGGCKVVSRHLVGSESAPDPECPRVIDHRKKSQSGSKSGPSRAVKALPLVM
jgi:radical SAM protein with 4Fe4S-binding SPASM domain